MNVAPILPSLLKQTIEYEEATQGEYRVEFASPIEISKVCVQIMRGYSKNNDYKANTGFSAVIFYDATISTPQGIEFTTDSRITYRNRKYTIARVVEETIGDTLHHVELEVV